MRQKLALARALLHNPPVLLLDEPTSAMDPESAHLVRDAIRDLRSASRAIIICTHNLAEAEELADQIAIIRRGKIIASGSPNELKQSYAGSGGVRSAPGMPPERQRIPLPAEHQPVRAGARIGCATRRLSAGSEPGCAEQPARARACPSSGLYEIPRSLEQVYMNAINAPERKTQVENV